MGQLDMRCLEAGHLCDWFGRHIWLPWSSPELVVVNKEKLALIDQVLMLCADSHTSGITYTLKYGGSILISLN